MILLQQMKPATPITYHLTLMSMLTALQHLHQPMSHLAPLIIRLHQQMACHPPPIYHAPLQLPAMPQPLLHLQAQVAFSMICSTWMVVLQALLIVFLLDTMVQVLSRATLTSVMGPHPPTSPFNNLTPLHRPHHILNLQHRISTELTEFERFSTLIDC